MSLKDVNQLLRDSHEDDLNAQRVVIVGQKLDFNGIDIAKSLKDAVSEIKFPIPEQPKAIETQTIVKEIEIREVPVIVKELEIKEIRIPEIVREHSFERVEIPVVIREIQIVEKPVVIEKIENLKWLLVLNSVGIIFALVLMAMK